MERVIVIRFGELFLKGKNRDYFESMLVRNIKWALEGVDCVFERSQGRYFVENFAEDDCDEIIDRLKKVFGIHSLSVADKVAEGKLRFRVTVKRADKRIEMTSAEIAAALGGSVLSLGKFKVDLTDYDCDFKVDIRENGFALVYTDVIAGAGGLPVGCSGRGMLLLSGGIDSPVAAYMMAKRGMGKGSDHPHRGRGRQGNAYGSFRLCKRVDDHGQQIRTSRPNESLGGYFCKEHCNEEEKAETAAGSEDQG